MDCVFAFLFMLLVIGLLVAVIEAPPPDQPIETLNELNHEALEQIHEASVDYVESVSSFLEARVNQTQGEDMYG